MLIDPEKTKAIEPSKPFRRSRMRLRGQQKDKFKSMGCLPAHSYLPDFELDKSISSPTSKNKIKLNSSIGFNNEDPYGIVSNPVHNSNNFM